ncbi:hypothetical protein HAX54_001973, partial [Datura stramonium]|nr:hypothetical protein [Datura stramonium]
VMTWEKAKAREAAEATSPLPQFEEGGEGTESKNEDPPADDIEEGDNNAEKSGDDDSVVEESGVKENTVVESGDKESSMEESGEQEEDSNPHTTPKARSKT